MSFNGISISFSIFTLLFNSHTSSLISNSLIFVKQKQDSVMQPTNSPPQAAKIWESRNLVRMRVDPNPTRQKLNVYTFVTHDPKPKGLQNWEPAFWIMSVRKKMQDSFRAGLMQAATFQSWVQKLTISSRKIMTKAQMQQMMMRLSLKIFLRIKKMAPGRFSPIKFPTRVVMKRLKPRQGDTISVTMLVRMTWAAVWAVFLKEPTQRAMISKIKIPRAQGIPMQQHSFNISLYPVQYSSRLNRSMDSFHTEYFFSTMIMMVKYPISVIFVETQIRVSSLKKQLKIHETMIWSRMPDASTNRLGLQMFWLLMKSLTKWEEQKHMYPGRMQTMKLQVQTETIYSWPARMESWQLKKQTRTKIAVRTEAFVRPWTKYSLNF